MITPSIKGVLNIESRNSVPEEKIHQVKNLEVLLFTRLKNHICNRIGNKKHDHWCLAFTKDNIPRVAAALVYFDHVKKDLYSANENTTLLVHPDDVFLLVTSSLEALEGSYLHYHHEEQVWVRAGKTVSSDMFDPICSLFNRNKTHLASAKSINLNNEVASYLYIKLSSRDNSNGSNILRSGYFEDL